jgi:hypothetical protein
MIAMRRFGRSFGRQTGPKLINRGLKRLFAFSLVDRKARQTEFCCGREGRGGHKGFADEVENTWKLVVVGRQLPIGYRSCARDVKFKFGGVAGDREKEAEKKMATT